MSDDSENSHLEIEYEGESDTLWIGNGRPGSIGFDITHGILIPFFDTDGIDPNSRIPIGVMLSPAAGLLSPHLPIEAIANAEPVSHLDRLDLEIRYDAATDTLWMGNGMPTPISTAIVDGVIVLYFYEEDDWRIPSGVSIYNAVKHIEPAILADLTELARESVAAGATE